MSHAREGNAAVFSHALTGFAHPARNVSALGVEPGMKVADFGSGSGAYVLAIAEALAGSGQVYAIDIQKDLLRRTKNEAEKKGYKNVEILWADLEAPLGSKIADDALELVLISNLLFQIEDKRQVLHEAKRILRPNGRLAVIDWAERSGHAGSAGVREGVGKREFPVSEGSERSERWKTEGFQGGMGPHKDDVVKKEDVLTLARAVELTFVKEFPVGAHHYGLIFRKQGKMKP